MTRRALAATIALVSTCTLAAAVAVAADHPVIGREIVLRRTPGNPAGSLRVVIEQGFPGVVPDPGSGDDPSREGMTVTLFARDSDATASFHAAPGRGARAWKVRVTPRMIGYAYKDPHANSDPLQIRSARLRTGAPLRITAPAAGLPLDVVHTAIAVRVEFGSQRVCALFDPESVQRSEPGIFVAREGDANLLPNCNDETLSGECPTGTCTPPRVCGGRPVTAACSWMIETRQACEQEGGCWQVTPFRPSGICNCPTHDPGKTCNEPEDCEGACFSSEGIACESRTTAQCSDTKIVFGCVCLAGLPGEFYPICLD